MVTTARVRYDYFAGTTNDSKIRLVGSGTSPPGASRHLLQPPREMLPAPHRVPGSAFRKISYFPLAKKVRIPSLPVPCQESEEKQKHGKPLPSVSKSLELGKFFVGNKGLATCCKARTASASVVLGKLLSSPMLTLETSGRIFLFPVKLEIAATNNSPVR
jgi:hypothetical protein